MIIHPFQKLLHKLRATMLPAIIRELIKDSKVLLEDWFVRLFGEMDINSRTGSPFVNAALDLTPEYQ
jgi:hypothetical protein